MPTSNPTPDNSNLKNSALKVSMFQISEQMRSGLLKVSAMSVIHGDKKSVNTCILEALDRYLNLPEDELIRPETSGLPLRPYTVRMTDEMKKRISMNAAGWQIKLGMPVTMNAVVNTAITEYLKLNGGE